MGGRVSSGSLLAGNLLLVSWPGGWYVFQTEARLCRDVYEGGCSKRVGPPKWTHRSNSAGGGRHPTDEQALSAAHSPTTPSDALRALGDWDEAAYGTVRHAARENPNYPHGPVS